MAKRRLFVLSRNGYLVVVMASRSIIPIDRIQNAILLIRGQKVLLDFDLATLYGVETRVLVQAVKRNLERFPSDFMYVLTTQEFATLRSQNVIPRSWGGRRTPPYAFTEQGVAMLSSVLRSKRAIDVNIEIMRAFVKLRQLLASHEDLARKLRQMEKKYDHNFAVVFKVLGQLTATPKVPEMGFKSKKRKKS